MEIPQIQMPSAFGVGLADMMVNLQQSLPAVTSALFGFCYLAGFWMVFKALYKLRQYGELRTMMSSNTDLREPMMMFLAAGFLLYMPTAIGIFQGTFFSNYTASSISYKGNATQSQFEIIKTVVINLIRIIGLIAIIKGILSLATLGAQSAGGQNSLGKALTFLIGGIFAANLEGLITVLKNSLGIVS
jgi:intracellular multiplication protein IcmC